jgi:predicted transcriptional regulator of viral defense system
MEEFGTTSTFIGKNGVIISTLESTQKVCLKLPHCCFGANVLLESTEYVWYCESKQKY